MSGFVAIFNTNGEPIDRDILEDLTTSLFYRGPDQQQIWTNRNVGLGHTLFRTTHEAQYENQPASLNNEVWITGCIRIDAREELVEKLGMHRDVRLAKTPDSHLVLHAYNAWGEECVEHLLGDFAFAIWDSKEQKLFCARDRFGMRQLVYAHKADTFIVCNSINCVREHPLVSDQLCETAIADFLLFGDHRWGSKARTSFADIQALEPAHSLTIKNGIHTARRYWNAGENTSLLEYKHERQYLEHFEELLKASISDRIRSKDVLISLSGGMDSSSIAAIFRGIQGDGQEQINLNAATVLYDSIHESDEREYADMVHSHLDLTPHYIDGGTYPFMSPPVQTTLPLELYQPKLWLDFDTYALTKSRVLLNGDAGDELLLFSSAKSATKDAGILKVILSTYRMKALYGKYPPFGMGIRRKIQSLFGQSKRSKTPYSYPYPNWINPDLEARLDLKEYWFDWWNHWHLEQAQNKQLHHAHIFNAITAPDWNTDDIYMNCGLTLPDKRSPFLDPRLLSFVNSIPALPWLFNKHLLRKAMHDKLPAAITQRPKTALGFIHDPLLKHYKQEEFSHENQSIEVSKYIDIAKSHLPSKDSTESYIDARPILLKKWIQELEK